MADLLRMLAQAGGGFSSGGYNSPSFPSYPPRPNPYQPRTPSQLSQLANQHSRQLQQQRQQFLSTAPQTTMQQPTAPAVGPAGPLSTFDERFNAQQPPQAFPGGRIPMPRPDPIDAYVSRPARQATSVDAQMIDPTLPPGQQ